MAAVDDRLRYALPEDRHERIFQHRILPCMLPPHVPVAHPTAVILGGQPGAGKTTLLSDAARMLGAQGATVVINGDDLRSFHPAYARLQRTDPLNAARYTDHDSGRWVEKLIDAAQAQRVNLVIESTMRRPEVFQRTGGRLRAAGYRVEAWAMAVPERLSWQGVHQRYEAMLANGNVGRFSTREAHDAAVTGMLNTLRLVERDRLADRVLIGTRAGVVLDDNQTEGGVWREPARAAEAVQAERSRPRTLEERHNIERGWVEVIDSMRRRQAPTNELARVTAQAANDMLFFEAAASPMRNPMSSTQAQDTAAPAVENTQPLAKPKRSAVADVLNALRQPASNIPVPWAPPPAAMAERLAAFERLAAEKAKQSGPASQDAEPDANAGPKPSAGPKP